MTVAKVTSESYGNLGKKGTRSDNEMVAIDGIILTTSDWSASIADLALEATFTAGIKSGSVMPLTGLDGYEDQSSEDTIYEASSGKRKLLKRGKTRMMYQLDAPFSVQEVPADGSTPAFTPVYIDMDNYREWDIYGEFLAPSWEPNSLEALVDVVLEVQGTPTTSEVIVKVYSADGYDSDGAVNEVGIKGIVEADFTTGFGTATGFTDNADGTYTFTSSAAFSTGACNLVAPSSMASTGLLIKSTGAVTVTIA